MRKMISWLNSEQSDTKCLELMTDISHRNKMIEKLSEQRKNLLIICYVFFLIILAFLTKYIFDSSDYFIIMFLIVLELYEGVRFELIDFKIQLLKSIDHIINK